MRPTQPAAAQKRRRRGAGQLPLRLRHRCHLRRHRGPAARPTRSAARRWASPWRAPCWARFSDRSASGRPWKPTGAGRCCARWPSSTSCRRSAAAWRGTGARWSSSVSSAAWPSAGRRWRRRCTSPRLPGRAARAAGGHQPAQHRRRHPGRLPVELDRRAAGGRTWIAGLARDARRAGAAGGALLRLLGTVPESPRWLDQAAAAPGGRGGAAPCRQRGAVGGGGRDRRVAASGDGVGRRAVLHAQIPAAHPAGADGGDVQSAVGHQRAHLLHRRHLRHGRRRAGPARCGSR